MGRECYVIAYVFPLQSLGILKRTADNLKDPLFRFFEREVSLMHCLRETPLETYTLFMQYMLMIQTYVCALSSWYCPSGKVWSEAAKACAW